VVVRFGYSLKAMFLVLGLSLASSSWACKVFLTNYQGQADFKVFITQYNGQQKNHNLIKDCRLTKFQGQAKWKLFVTPYKGQADIVITVDNFPS